MSVTVDQLRARLQSGGWNPRPGSRGLRARCPAHEGRNPSLEIWSGDDGRAMVICWSKGCDWRRIYSSLGFDPGQSGNGGENKLPQWSAARRAERIPQSPKPPFADLARQFASALSAERARRLADGLGLTVTSLRRIGCGYMDAHPMPIHGGRIRPMTAWTFPMSDERGMLIGLRIRALDGGKYSYTGGSNGLTLPRGLAVGGQLLLPEGPTSLAALLILGFNAVGRFNNRGGVDQIVQLCRRLGPSRVVVMANNDPFDPKAGHRPGLWGGAIVAEGIVRSGACRDVRIVTPAWGAKDERIWLAMGATTVDVQTRIEDDWLTPARAAALARNSEEVAHAQ